MRKETRVDVIVRYRLSVRGSEKILNNAIPPQLTYEEAQLLSKIHLAGGTVEGRGGHVVESLVNKGLLERFEEKHERKVEVYMYRNRAPLFGSIAEFFKQWWANIRGH